MKDLFKKIFSEKTSSPIFVGFGVFAIFTFIVFPGLTVANTVLNILAALIGVFTLTFIFYYLEGDKLYKSITDLEPGETELDYINPEELKPKKKKTIKKDKPIAKVKKSK